MRPDLACLAIVALTAAAVAQEKAAADRIQVRVSCPETATEPGVPFGLISADRRARKFLLFSRNGQCFSWGAVPPGTRCIDLDAVVGGGTEIELGSLHRGRARIDFVHNGQPRLVFSATLYWSVDFRGSLASQPITHTSSTLVKGLPEGIPIAVRIGQQDPHQFVISPGKVAHVRVTLPQPFSGRRYRLVDPSGKPIAAAPGNPHVSFRGPDRTAQVLLSTAHPHYILRVPDGRGGHWLSKPINVAAVPSGAILDGGDLTVYPPDAGVYCRGRVVDEQGRPLPTRPQVLLSDGNAGWQETRCRADGSFVMPGGVNFPQKLPMRVVGYQVLGEEVFCRRGQTGVLLRVRKVFTPPPIVFRLQGQGDAALGHTWKFEVRDPQGIQHGFTIYGSGGRRGLRLPSGRWRLTPIHRRGTSEPLRLATRTLVIPSNPRDPVAKVPAWEIPKGYRGVRLHAVGVGGQAISLQGEGRRPLFTIVAEAGEELTFQTRLTRAFVKQDSELRVDPVLTRIEIMGLERFPRHRFVLGVTLPGCSCLHRNWINGEVGQVFAPRGVELQARLYVLLPLFRNRQSTDLESVEIPGFKGRFRIPPRGQEAKVRLRVPEGLATFLDDPAARPR